MSFDAHANFAYSVVATAPSPAGSGTSLIVATGEGALFPATPFNATIWASGEVPLTTNATIVRVTSVVGDVLTFVRAQEGSTERSILVGDQIAATITAKTLTDVETAIPSTAGLLSAINVSAGTKSDNLSALTFSNAGGVTFGLALSVLTATVATNYQSQGAYLTTAMQSDAATLSNVRLSGGTLSSHRSDLTFADSNGVSFGLNTNGVLTATVKTDYQSSGAYLTTAMASNRGSDFVQAAAGFHGTNASGTIASDGISVSVAAAVGQSNQTVGLYASSNTNLTSSGTVDARSLSFRAVGPLSIGYSAGELVFSNVAQTAGAYLTTAALSADSSKYAGTGFTSAGANVGISGTHNTAGLSLSMTVAAQSNQSAIKGFGVSNTGQTAGNTGISSGVDWVLAGSQSLTLSQSTAGGGPNTVWFQHPAWLTTAALSADSSKYAGTGFTTTTGAGAAIAGTHDSAGLKLAVPAFLTTADLSANSSKYVQEWALTGNTAGTTSSAQGTRLQLSGGQGITLSGNSNTIVLSVGSYITTGRASTDAVGLNTAKTNVTWTVNSSGISLDAGGYAGTGFTTAGNNIGLSGTHGTNGLSLSASVAAQSNQSAIKGFGVTSTGNTAGNTGISTGIDWVLAGSNSITLSQSTTAGGPNTVWMQVGPYLTTARASTDAIGLNTAKTNATWTVNSSGLSLDAGGYAGTGTSATNASITLNSNGLAVSVAAPGAAAENNWVALLGNTAGNSTASGSTIGWSGGNGVTLSGTNNSIVRIDVATYASATTVQQVASANSVGTVTRWAMEDHAHAGVGAIGISTAGNTAGTTGSEQGTYWLQGGSNITLSQITSNNGSHTLIVSGAVNTIGFYEPYPQTNTAGLALVAGSWYFVPFEVGHQVSGGRINFLHVNTSTAGIVRDITGGSYVSSSSGGKNQSYTYSKAVALYSQGTGTNSTRLESFWSNSFSFGLSHRVLVSQSGANSSVSVTVSQSISYISEIGSDGNYTLNQFASNNNSAGTNTSIASNALDSVGVSVRNMLSNSLIVPVGFNTTIQPGVYWLAVAWSSTTASATSQTSFAGASALMFSELSQVGISRLELNSAYRNWGSTATTARSGIMPGGVYTAAANMAPPQFVALSSDLASVASQWQPYFNFQARGLTK
jgi:hypothetical protein